MKLVNRMEEIMVDLEEHLKPTVDNGADENIHHYNRTLEKIGRWFSRHNTQPANAVDAGKCRGCGYWPVYFKNFIFCPICGGKVRV